MCISREKSFLGVGEESSHGFFFKKKKTGCFLVFA